MPTVTRTDPGCPASLGAVMILMLWFYMTGLAFLAGGQITPVRKSSDRNAIVRSASF